MLERRTSITRRAQRTFSRGTFLDLITAGLANPKNTMSILVNLGTHAISVTPPARDAVPEKIVVEPRAKEAKPRELSDEEMNTRVWGFLKAAGERSRAGDNHGWYLITKQLDELVKRDRHARKVFEKIYLEIPGGGW